MRLLRLELAKGQLTVDLHPFVTVLRLLDEAQRKTVMSAGRSLARGSTAGIRGLLEHDGILVELDGWGDDRLAPATAADVVIAGLGPGPINTVALQAQIDQLERRAEIESVMVEELRADLAPAARARLAEIKAQLAPVDEEELARKAALRAQVETCLRTVAGLDPVIAEAPPGVTELRARWVRYSSRLSEADAHFAALHAAIETAEAGLLTAEAALETAEAALAPVFLTREEEARLEMLSFPSMDESRRGRWRKQLRPEEEDEKQQLLDKVGLESWTAYNVYRMDPTPSPEKVAAEADARRSRDGAQATLDKANVALASDRLHAELNGEIDAIREEASTHLGAVLPADLGAALAGLVVERPNPDYAEAVTALESALADAGTPVDGGAAGAPTAAAIAALRRADAWLREQQEDRGPDLDALRAAASKAERDLLRHERALARIDRAERAAMATALELDRLERLLVSCADGESPTVDAIIGRIDPLVDRLRSEVDGSLPIVLVEVLAGLDDDDARTLLDHLGTIAEHLQVVVISDRDVAIRWAADVGLDRALVSGPKPTVGKASTISDPPLTK